MGWRQRAAQRSQGTLAPLGPPSRRVWPRWLFCAAAAHRALRGGLQCPSVSKCPPAVPLSSESLHSTLERRRGFEPPACLLQEWQRRNAGPAVGCVGRGAKAGSRGLSFTQGKLLSTHQVLGIVLGPSETRGNGRMGSLPSGSFHSSRREVLVNPGRRAWETLLITRLLSPFLTSVSLLQSTVGARAWRRSREESMYHSHELKTLI